MYLMEKMDGPSIIGCDDFVEEAKDLLQENWDEMGLGDFDELKLNLKMEYYRTLEACNQGFTSVYRVDGKIVGYCNAFVEQNAHNSDELFGSSDVIFFDKRYRNGRRAAELLTFVEQECYNRGARYFSLASNLNRGIGLWLMRKNYKPVEVVYFKRLGE